MRITKFGHACLLVEEAGARFLIDPGAYSKGFEGAEGLAAILITHQHQDHLVVDNIKQLLEKNPDAVVLADEGSARLLADAGVAAQEMHAGDEMTMAGVKVEVIGKDHAVIHHDVPTIPNVGYMIAGKFFYPGDAYTEPGRMVEVLAAPAGAPWLKMSEAVDYVRAVKPKVAIPVHDAVLAIPEMNYGLMKNLTSGQNVEVRVVPNGQATEI